MKPETLEKLFDWCNARILYLLTTESRYDQDCAVFADELRALVKAESEPSFLDEYADEFYNHGGEPRESDVQAEGRGEISGIIIPERTPLKVVVALQNFVNVVEAYKETGVWPDNGTIRRLADEGMEALRASPSREPKPHNPDNLPSPGEGYRFLDEDEVGAQWNRIPFIHEIERWEKPGWSASCWQGSIRVCTYRTRLTREQLAKKRKEAGR